MWKSAYVGVYQLLNWKMHGETLKFAVILFNFSNRESLGKIRREKEKRAEAEKYNSSRKFNPSVKMTLQQIFVSDSSRIRSEEKCR